MSRFAVLDHRRRGDAFHVEHRRMLLIDVHDVPELPAEVVRDKRGISAVPLKLIRLVTARLPKRL